jgi:hypothetical protein
VFKKGNRFGKIGDKKTNEIISQTEDITIFFIESESYGSKECIVDTEDWVKINKCMWHLVKSLQSGSYYAYRNKWVNGKNKSIPLHRILLNLTDSKIFVDHKNLDTLDNRKINLRECNNSQNMSNRGKQKNNTSGYKGVFWSKEKNKWEVQITANGIKYHIGRFKDKIEAARAYNNAAIKHHGEFIGLNNV